MTRASAKSDTKIFYLSISDSYWPDGTDYPLHDNDKLYGYFHYRILFGYALIFQNTFQLYIDIFVLYLILRFTREKTNRSEQTVYDELLKQHVPSVVFIRN